MTSASDQQYGVATERAANIAEDNARWRLSLSSDMPLLIPLINCLLVERIAPYVAALLAAIEHEATPNERADGVPFVAPFPQEYALEDARKILGMTSPQMPVFFNVGSAGACDATVLYADSKSLLPILDYPSADRPQQRRVDQTQETSGL